MAQRVESGHLARVQSETVNIRNFCILAHVDHGKTTLSDSLVSSNGIISARLAGKLRYLDSTEEEQKRGITMHSSAISLLYRPEPAGTTTGAAAVGAAGAVSGGDSGGGAGGDGDTAAASEEYLINLIDSPGHIDFSSDVSAATRLCDGALIVVDAVEGLCTQTHAVIYKALKERMTPCLVLNKVDRLCVELQLTPTEAYHHLKRLVENVNGLAFTLLNSELMIRSFQRDEANANEANANGANASGGRAQARQGLGETGAGEAGAEAGEAEEDPLFQDWNFEPQRGNVVFCSALDCWGFVLPKFAAIWGKRLGVSPKVLRRYLFEDCYFNSSSKKIVKCGTGTGAGSGGEPMFAQLVLAPLWQLYKTAIEQGDAQKAADMALKGFGVILPPREINPRDPRATLQAILRRWLPLADALLRMVIRVVPSPQQAQGARLFTLLPEADEQEQEAAGAGAVDAEAETERIDAAGAEEKEETDPGTAGVPSETAVRRSCGRVRRSVAACASGSDAPVLVFVSKMFPVRRADLAPRDVAMLQAQAGGQGQGWEDGEVDGGSGGGGEEEVFMALGRVFSGTLRRDSRLYVLSKEHDPMLVRRGLGRAQVQGQAQTQVQGLAQGQGQGVSEDAYMDTCVDAEQDMPLHLTPAESAASVSTPTSSTDCIGLYMVLGPSVLPVDSVPAGNVVGILGVADALGDAATATLCSTWQTPPMTAITFQTRPMLRVAVEVDSHLDLRRLERGLRLLRRSDAVVETGVDPDTGQHTITCLGELHLEQCVNALRDRFARCNVRASEPLIAYRESVLVEEGTDASTGVGTGTRTGGSNRSGNGGGGSGGGGGGGIAAQLPPPWCDMTGLSSARGGRLRVLYGGGNVALTLRAFPLPAPLLSHLEKSAGLVERINVSLARQTQRGGIGSSGSGTSSSGDGNSSSSNAYEQSGPLGAFWRGVGASLTPAQAVVGEDPLAPVDAALSMGTEIGTGAGAGTGTEIGAGAGTGAVAGTAAGDVSALRSRVVAIGAPKHPTNLLLLGAECRIEVWRVGGGVGGGAGGLRRNDEAEGPQQRLFSIARVGEQTAPADDASGVGGMGVDTVAGITGVVFDEVLFLRVWARLQSACSAAFRAAAEAGPLMREPLHGVGFVVERVEVGAAVCAAALGTDMLGAMRRAGIGGEEGDEHRVLREVQAEAEAVDASAGGGSGAGAAVSTGQLISELKDALHVCILSLPTRIVEPVFRCDLQCDQSQLGNLYAVLASRRGEVVDEDIIEGTTLFVLAALLPVQASFGFAQALLKRTSGAGTAPQMRFSHWAVLDTDPFWRPTSEQELEEFGETVGAAERSRNLPRTIVDGVRRRKGLAVEEQVVACAEKQRTLNKKK
ncbi:hypothetical protein B484DRAFT_28254 [Ochromonadaceae sp. CCMP2298]|nr:hypothetical protein B484DRAFT_28254 [Ochromonadaceae sp. CCMP2298]